MLILEADYSNDCGTQLWVVMEPEKPWWSYECWRLLVPTHALPTGTGNITNGDGATAPPAQKEGRSPVSSTGWFLLFPREISVPYHMFWRLTSAVGETGSIFPLWKLFQSEESEPAGCANGKHFRALEPHQEDPGCLCWFWQHQLNPLPPQEEENPCLCPMEQTWRLVRSIFHCNRVFSEAWKLLSNTQDTAWSPACLGFLVEFFEFGRFTTTFWTKTP